MALSLIGCGGPTIAEIPLSERAAPVQESEPVPAAPGAADVLDSQTAPLDRLAVEKNGRTIFLEPDQIYSIKAEAHYSRVFDGTEDYFCSRSLSDLQDQLDPRLFLRVHRSHIVNIRHARAFEKEREQGRIDLQDSRPIRVGEVDGWRMQIQASGGGASVTGIASGRSSRGWGSSAHAWTATTAHHHATLPSSPRRS